MNASMKSIRIAIDSNNAGINTSPYPRTEIYWGFWLSKIELRFYGTINFIGLSNPLATVIIMSVLNTKKQS